MFICSTFYFSFIILLQVTCDDEDEWSLVWRLPNFANFEGNQEDKYGEIKDWFTNNLNGFNGTFPADIVASSGQGLILFKNQNFLQT